MLFKMYINGAWREGTGGYRDVVSPVNGEVLGQLCMGTAADVDAAVQGAVKHLEQLGAMTTQILTAFNPAVIPAFWKGYMGITLLIIGAYVMHFLPRSLTDRAKSGYIALSPLWQAIILALALFLVIQTRQADLVPFVYLQY